MGMSRIFFCPLWILLFLRVERLRILEEFSSRPLVAILPVHDHATGLSPVVVSAFVTSRSLGILADRPAWSRLAILLDNGEVIGSVVAC